MALVKINWAPNKRESRKFGLVTLIGFFIIGLALNIFGKELIQSYYACGIGIVIGVPALSGIRVIAMPGYVL